MSNIFLMHDENLVEMTERGFESEDKLQALLARFPHLLSGDRPGSASVQWLLVTREMGVPAAEGGGDHWSLDHLFLDQEAVPTLVEVKRSSDTRIRREVVGQILDYAANAVVYWPVEAIRARFEQTCQERGTDPKIELSSFLGPGTDVEEFWQRVKTNLQAGRIRMVFVADAIPQELRRIVEFLNGQMDPAEVLAVEIRQFVGPGAEQQPSTLVANVIGQTAEAERKKPSSRGEGRQWDEESFFRELRVRQGDQETAVARAIYDWARERSLRFSWGKGGKDGSMYPVLDHAGSAYWAISIWTYGRIEVQFQWMKEKPPFSDEIKRRKLRDLLNEIPGVQIPEDAIARRPSIRLEVLAKDTDLRKFLGVLDWYIEQVKAV
jgi:hypothetical protein